MFGIHRNSMTESAPKRAKMATDQSASTSTGALAMDSREFPQQKNSGKNAKMPQFWFAPGEQDFRIIKDVSAFSDHTLLIKTLLNCRTKTNEMTHQPVLITAPRRFGKSTNLSMVEYFLEIQRNEKGIPIKGPEDLKEPVEDTANYKMFENLKIMQHKDAAELVKEHFGRHPVIHLDLKGIAAISNADDVLMHCRGVLHKAFQRHKYLQGKFDDSENKFISSWCDRAEYRTFAKEDVLDGLLDLATLLHKYFQRKVFILVDEYDCIARKVISQCTDKLEVEKGIDIYMTMLGNAIKGDGDSVTNCVQGAMLTGISYIAGMGLSDALNNVTAYRFLGDHEFVEFYGLTESEVQRIAQEYAEYALKKLTDWYNGYESKPGEKIYSIWSVGKALTAGNVSNYWGNTGEFYHLVDMLKIPQISAHILELLNGKHVTFKLLEKITVEDIASLNKEIKSTSLDLLFSMMLEEGYLTMVKSSKENEQEGVNTVKVRLPNKEIISEISTCIADHFLRKIYRFDNLKIMQCANFFDNVKSFDTQNADFKVALKKFRDNLTELLEGFSPEKILQLNEDHLHRLMYIISSKTDYWFGTEFHVYKEDKTVGIVDLVMSRAGEFGIIVELKFNKTKGKNTRDKNKKSRRNKNKMSREALLQILNPKTQYMSTLTERNIKKYFLIGVSIDDNTTPHISCLLNSTDIDRALHL